MRNNIIILLLFATGFSVSSQTIFLETCQEMARVNFPLLKQQHLIEQTAETSASALISQYFPQIQIVGKASYQSDVTRLDLTLPKAFPVIDIPIPDKDQYGIYTEISQVIFDGGTTRLKRENIKANAKIEQQKIEIELYKLQNKVNQTYFAILLMDEQKKQVALLERDLNTALENVKVLVKNGVSLMTNQQNLEAELLNVVQKRMEIETNRTAYIKMLSLLTGKNISEQSTFRKPALSNQLLLSQRPELTLMDYKRRKMELNRKELTANNLPKMNLFFRGGYGKPALNLFSNEFEPYYVAGVQLNWQLSRLYTLRKEKQNIDTQRKMLDVQRDAFLINNKLEAIEQDTEIKKLRRTLTTDDEIVKLRTEIKQTSDVQLKNGIITSAEFIRNANQENQARQKKALHEMQLLMAEYHLNWINSK